MKSLIASCYRRSTGDFGVLFTATVVPVAVKWRSGRNGVCGKVDCRGRNLPVGGTYRAQKLWTVNAPGAGAALLPDGILFLFNHVRLRL
jgi:hypothetical protein